jgi:hypothetical protein
MAVRKLRLPAALALAFTLCGASAAGCELRRQQAGGADANSRKPGGQAAPAGQAATGGEGEKAVTTTDGELKTLGAGGYSQVNEAFVLVARDAQTYGELRKLAPGLPELGADFFSANAVVAAFLGQRPSGGYAVEIAREADGGLRVSEKSPPKDAIRTMALTSPYSVVASPWPGENPVRLSLGPPWRERARPYRVTAGEFTMMGGFAGVREPFRVAGALGVLRHKDLATVLFDLKGEGDRRARALADVATGTVSSGRLSLRVDPGTFILPPRDRMSAAGTFGAGENKLSLTLEGMQTKVADGFGGRGTLEAEATAPAPPKRALDDEPM